MLIDLFFIVYPLAIVLYTYIAIRFYEQTIMPMPAEKIKRRVYSFFLAIWPVTALYGLLFMFYRWLQKMNKRLKDGNSKGQPVNEG